MMKRLIVVALLTANCSWYIDSFKGPPGGTSEPIIGTRSYSYINDNWIGGESITVTIIQSERTRPWCFLDAMGINCEFPSAYLMEFAAMTAGGWISLDMTTARQICDEALWSVNAPQDARRQCAFALLEMRFQEALPPTNDPNQ